MHFNSKIIESPKRLSNTIGYNEQDQLVSDPNRYYRPSHLSVIREGSFLDSKNNMNFSSNEQMDSLLLVTKRERPLKHINYDKNRRLNSDLENVCLYLYFL